MFVFYFISKLLCFSIVFIGCFIIYCITGILVYVRFKVHLLNLLNFFLFCQILSLITIKNEVTKIL